MLPRLPGHGFFLLSSCIAFVPEKGWRWGLPKAGIRCPPIGVLIGEASPTSGHSTPPSFTRTPIPRRLLHADHSHREGNPYLDVVIRIGMGHTRNAILVNSADAAIAVRGGYGTFSVIAAALNMDKPVFSLSTWNAEGVFVCATPRETVILAVHAARLSRPSRSHRDPGEPS